VSERERAERELAEAQEAERRAQAAVAQRRAEHVAEIDPLEGESVAAQQARQHAESRLRQIEAEEQREQAETILAEMDRVGEEFDTAAVALEDAFAKLVDLRGRREALTGVNEPAVDQLYVELANRALLLRPHEGDSIRATARGANRIALPRWRRPRRL
jgi:hypothetical protein